MTDMSKFAWIADEWPGIWQEFTKLDKETFKYNVLSMTEHLNLSDNRDAIFMALYGFRSGLCRGEEKARRRYKAQF